MNSHTEKFDSLLVSNPFLTTTLGNFFIPEMRYTYTYTSPANVLNPIRWETTVAESGNLTSLIFAARGKKWNEREKTLFKNPYSQFVKLETDFTKTWTFSPFSRLVGHLNAGIIHYYGNSTYAPFSELFYVGGANSIRGFPVRTLGPGAFPRYDDMPEVSYLTQNGELKFVANLEYRTRLFGNLYGALFLDAGNVWNIKQNHGDDQYNETNEITTFRLSNLPRQMALGTGFGLRYDLDFLVLRLDWGVALHAPYDTGKSGYFNINSFKHGQALHFAIGYPF